MKKLTTYISLLNERISSIDDYIYVTNERISSLDDYISEKLKIKKGFSNINEIIETFYTGSFTQEQIIDMIDETFGRENHNIVLTNYNTINDEHYCSVKYKNDDDLIKLLAFIEMLFGPSMYNGELRNSEDIGFYIQDKEIVKRIGLKYQTEIDDIIQNFDVKFYNAYKKIIKR
jgi:hypothetical protein